MQCLYLGHIYTRNPPYQNPPFVIWFSYFSTTLIFVDLLICSFDTSDVIVMAAHFLQPYKVGVNLI